jgi:hypothetical protein
LFQVLFCSQRFIIRRRAVHFGAISFEGFIELQIGVDFYWCTQKVSTPLQSVSVSVRPSVYMITFDRRVRSWWNFLEFSLINILAERRRWAWLDEPFLSYCKNTDFFLWFSLRISIYHRYRKKLFYHSWINPICYIPFDWEFYELQNGT